MSALLRLFIVKFDIITPLDTLQFINHSINVNVKINVKKITVIFLKTTVIFANS